MRFMVNLREPQCDQLAKHASPCDVIQIGAHTEHAELVVIPSADTLAAFAP